MTYLVFMHFWALLPLLVHFVTIRSESCLGAIEEGKKKVGSITGKRKFVDTLLTARGILDKAKSSLSSASNKAKETANKAKAKVEELGEKAKGKDDEHGFHAFLWSTFAAHTFCYNPFWILFRSYWRRKKKGGFHHRKKRIRGILGNKYGNAGR